MDTFQIDPWQDGEFIHSEWGKQFVDTFSKGGIPAHIHKISKRKVVQEAIDKLKATDRHNAINTPIFEKASSTVASKTELLKQIGKQLGIE